MSANAQSHELTYDLIKRAVHGDQQAIEAYLLHYDAYINSLVAYDEVGPDIITTFDEELWYTTVDVVKVSVDGKMTFVFRDGSTVEVMME